MANPADTANALLNVLDLPLAKKMIARVEDLDVKKDLTENLEALKARICEPDTIRLYTLMKSGTNYFRLFFANYLTLLKDPACVAVTYGTLEEVLPRNSYKTFETGNPYLEQTDYKHFAYLHGAMNIENTASKIITLHRNPLDFVVSYYHYRFKSRGDASYDTISSSVPIGIDIFSRTVGKWLSCKSRQSHLALKYEDFTEHPVDTMRAVIHHLGLPLNEALLETAAQRSSFGSVRAYEEKNGSIHGARGQFFTRSGRIGEWHDQLTPEDIAIAKQGLAKHHLEFIDENLMQVRRMPPPKSVAPPKSKVKVVQFSIRRSAPVHLMQRVLRKLTRLRSQSAR